MTDRRSTSPLMVSLSNHEPSSQRAADPLLGKEGEPKSDRSARRLLLVTFHYPPGNTSSGGLRPLKFSKYLPEFGWQVSVITVRESCHESIDHGQLGDIPATTMVHRTRCFDAKTQLSVRGRYPALFAIPDRYVSWLPFATATALRIMRQQRIDAVMSTSPIPTTHLICWAAKRITGVPWVADFRDPWVETDGSDAYGPARQAIELWLERRVVTNADRVTVTTREFRDFLYQRYPSLPPDQVVPLYNGYDEDDFRIAADGGQPDGFRIVHTGLLDPHYRNPAPVLAAARRALDEAVLPLDTCFEFIGGGPFASRPEFAELIAAVRMERHVRIVPRLPYREALAALGCAAVLLLLQAGDDTRMLIPAKAFEYLRSGLSILTIAPRDSATARLSQEFRGTVVAEPNDVPGIAGALALLADRHRTDARLIDREAEGLRRYSRRSATAALRAILDEVAAH